MRLVIVGRGSYIARHVINIAQLDHIETFALAHDADISAVVRWGDTVANFSIHPRYKSEPYNDALDYDLKIARIAAAAGATAVMFSTRKIYPESARWNARESDLCDGDDSHYGRNKARTEALIRDITGLSSVIFRLSNICGYEYSAHAPRKTFFGIMQHRLKMQNEILFDMHPSTRRDFLPVEFCARAVVLALKANLRGVYNLGAGFPVSCGDVANWIMEGFGGGTLVVDPPLVRDEFFLNMEKWSASLGQLPLSADALYRYCVDIGRKLKCGEF
jgi:dTDP-4-dehydrorhamnose reductase/UDP-glucose 4-epimerase